MHHANQKGKQHLLIVGGIANLARYHKLLDAFRQVDIHQRHSEERAEDGTDNSSADAQRYDQIHHAGQRLGQFTLQYKSQGYQNQSVTCIAHTESEKQRKERCNDRGGVKLCVIGHAIHLGQDLIQAHESIVLQFNRRIVFLGSLPYLIIYIRGIEELANFCFIFFRNPSFQQDDRAIRHPFTIKAHLHQVYVFLKLKICLPQGLAKAPAIFAQVIRCLRYEFLRILPLLLQFVQAQ